MARKKSVVKGKLKRKSRLFKALLAAKFFIGRVSEAKLVAVHGWTLLADSQTLLLLAGSRGNAQLLHACLEVVMGNGQA